MKVTSTGVKSLDHSLMDGLPLGFTVLVTGPPGSGTELLAKQFACAGGKESAVYFTTTERDEDILGTVKHFGWESKLKIVNIGDQYYQTVLARELEISKYRQEGITLEELQEGRQASQVPRRSQNFLTALTYEVSLLKPPFRCVIDSLDFFLENYGAPATLAAIRTIKAHTQRHEGVALMTLLSQVHDSRVESGIEEIVDCIIDLERERSGNAFKRNLVIRKVRNHPEMTGVKAFDIVKSGISADS